MAAQDRRSIGSYLVGNVLGKGGFGTVYKALDPQKGLFVAIKQMSLSSSALAQGDPGSIEMEISLLSKLKHRNIVKYIETIRTELHLNIVLEYVEGGALDKILKKFGAFPESLCAFYTRQILRGLAYLHSQGVVHRDIKGANALITKKGEVKLADFGVATKLCEVDNLQGKIVGTPYWMAPEIIDMSAAMPTCDLWSVGATVVEMLTGMPPYHEFPPMNAMYRIVQDPHPPLPDGISQGLERFLLACFEKEPNLRAGATDLLQHEWITENAVQIGESANQERSPASAQDDSDGEDEEPAKDVEAVQTFIATLKDPLSSLAAGTTAGGDAVTVLTVGEVSDGFAGGGAGGVAPAGSPSRGAASVPAGAQEEALNLACAAVFRQASVARTGGGGGGANSVVAGSLGAMLGGGSRSGSVALSGGRAQTVEVRAKTLEAEAPNGAGTSRTQSGSEAADGGANGGGYQFRFREYFNKLKAGSSEEVEGSPQQLSRRVSGGTGSRQLGMLREGKEGKATPPKSGPLSDAFGMQAGGGAVALGQRDAAEIKNLLGGLRPFEEPKVLEDHVKRLTVLVEKGGNQHLVMQHGAVPIVEMLQVTDPALLKAVLRLVNLLAKEAQEVLATVGLIPGVIKFAGPQHSPSLRREAAIFISRLCDTSDRSLQMLVACGGLEALADLVAHDYYKQRDLVCDALDALWRVFTSTPKVGPEGDVKAVCKNDFCRILAKHGLCGHLCVLIDTLASDIHEKASWYLRIVVELLLLFAREGDAIVKVYMANSSVLEGLISALEFLQLSLSVQIFETFRCLAQEPSVLNMLENAGLVPVLVHFLASLLREVGDAPVGEDQTASSPAQNAKSQCMSALFHLCRLSRPRQEQAALAGVIPLLQVIVEQKQPQKEEAFNMLCDMTSASLATRNLLWRAGGANFLVRRLRDPRPEVQTTSLEAIVGWIGVREHRADWCERLEGDLLQVGGEFLPQLLQMFGSRDTQVFMQALEQLLKLGASRLSSRFNAALSESLTFFEVVAARLQPQKRGPAQEPGSAVVVVAEGKAGSRPSPPTASPTSAVHRQASALLGGDGAGQDEDVRARRNLLELLLQICKGQGPNRLVALRSKHEHWRQLPELIREVFQEEQNKGRVILQDRAEQLLKILKEAQASLGGTPN